MALKKEDILSWLEGAKTPEIVEVIKSIEEKFGVSAAAAVAAPVAAVAAADEQTEFDVILSSFEATAKIAIIKVVKDIAGLSLADAKKLVEAAPKAVKEGVSKVESEEMKKKLEGAGAKVEIK